MENSLSIKYPVLIQRSARECKSGPRDSVSVIGCIVLLGQTCICWCLIILVGILVLLAWIFYLGFYFIFDFIGRFFFFSVLVLFWVSSLDGNAGSYLLVYRYGVQNMYTNVLYPITLFPPLLYNVLRKPEAITKKQKEISSGGKSDAVLIDKR